MIPQTCVCHPLVFCIVAFTVSLMPSSCKTDLSFSPQSLGPYFAVQVHGQVKKGKELRKTRLTWIRRVTQNAGNRICLENGRPDLGCGRMGKVKRRGGGIKLRRSFSRCDWRDHWALSTAAYTPICQETLEKFTFFFSHPHFFQPAFPLFYPFFSSSPFSLIWGLFTYVQDHFPPDHEHSTDTDTSNVTPSVSCGDCTKACATYSQTIWVSCWKLSF